MNYDLDHAMWATWQQIEARVLGNEIELRRRLDRRAKVFNRVPRALCLAIRAADRRITAMNAWMSPRWGSDKGMEEDHDLLITSSLVKQLCCPVHISAPGEPMTDVHQYLGCHYFTARKMERRGVVDVHAIRGLGGRKGKPVPLAYSPRPLDPCARGKAAPTEILEGFWEHIAARMPADMEQLVRRKPIFRLSAGQRKLVDWKWVCPSCKREVRTIYLPMGAPDWASLHDIKLDWYHHPSQHLCFACYRCHHLFGLARTPKSLKSSWSNLITHMSGGLLFGREVPPPPSFGILRANQPYSIARPSPRRDELENYLANTDLPLHEIARRMQWTYGSVKGAIPPIYRRRNVKGREALKQWWANNSPANANARAA